MFRVKYRQGSEEIDICAALVVPLVEKGMVRLSNARWPVEFGAGGAARQALVLLSDVESISPIRALTKCPCDEHGHDCP